KARGYAAFHSRVAWAADVTTRAEDLRQNVLRILDTSKADKVNIIAHSMGGLDARHMLFNDREQGRIHERVASLTTISTPHEGSPFADRMLEHFPQLPETLQKIGLDVRGLRDLRTDVCRRFNDDPEAQAFERACEASIRFRTFAGRQRFAGVFTPLKISFPIIEAAEGANAGLLSFP